MSQIFDKKSPYNVVDLPPSPFFYEVRMGIKRESNSYAPACVRWRWRQESFTYRISSGGHRSLLLRSHLFCFEKDKGGEKLFISIFEIVCSAHDSV